MRIPLRLKIILPFAVLLLFVGLVGTSLATSQLATAAGAQAEASLVRNSLLANQQLTQVDGERLAELRAATNTVGVAEAVSAHSATALATLLTPIAANAGGANLTIEALDLRGDPIVRIGPTPEGPHPVSSATVLDWSTVDPVARALRGGDSQGQRSVFMGTDTPRPTLYWVGPVQEESGAVVGAMLVGQSVDDLAAALTGLAFYRTDGSLLATSLTTPPTLPTDVIQRLTATNSWEATETQGTHQLGELFSAWTMHGTTLGYLAVVQDEDQVAAGLIQIRALFTVLFTAAALLVLLVGTLLASVITRRLERLVRAMRAVSAGDLAQRAAVKGRDEIGYLARTFNEMTESLAQKTADLEDTTFSSIEALARALDARDPSTAGHSERVAAISLEIADAMGLDQPHREALRRAALLHDIGKIGIDDSVLRKPGPLSSEEVGLMEAHPRVGYQMLKGLRFLETSLSGVLYHHERWDGEGYPHGLHGDEIPLVVRILSVADTFDAMTSERPYRRGLRPMEAATEIAAGAGTQFDPDVVSAFERRREAIFARAQVPAPGPLVVAEVA